VTLENLDAESARQLGLSPATKELLLPTSAHPVRSRLRIAPRGCHPGVNHQPVKNVSELNEAIHKAGRTAAACESTRQYLFIAA